MSKKFIFSAVALVAFSFAGMANTGGEEKLEIFNTQSAEEHKNCREYANHNASLELEAYGYMTLTYFVLTIIYYEELCKDNGGAVGEVVIIEG